MGNDLRFTDNGTTWSVHPLTAAGRDWVAANVRSEPWQWMGITLVVDHRFAGALIDGAAQELNVEVA